MSGWGPWIACDGTGVPPQVPEGNYMAQIAFYGVGIQPTKLTPDWPGLFWRMRRRFGVFGEKRPECFIRAYAPVVYIRLRKPPTTEASTDASFALLTGIVTGAVPPVEPVELDEILNPECRVQLAPVPAAPCPGGRVAPPGARCDPKHAAPLFSPQRPPRTGHSDAGAPGAGGPSLMSDDVCGPRPAPNSERIA